MFALLRPSAILAALLITGGLTSPARLMAADKRPMTLDDMFAFKRVAAPRISPDGKQVVYQVGTVDLEANKSSTALWLAATDGKTPPKQLTDPKGKKDAAPQWSPDGKQILFESTRSGTSQLWIVLAEGGDPKQITEISTGAATGIWSRDGTHLAFVSAVYPEFSEKPFAESDKLNKAKDEEIEKSPVKVKTFTKLFYRHWDEYVGDKRQHLFVIEFDQARSASKGEPHDATPGDRDAYPTSTTFSSGDDFTFSPDSKHLVFTAVPEKDESWSTNYDICRVSITNTSPKWECLTKDNKAGDSGPKFSPDGKKLAWRAQKKVGYEADKWDIVVADCNSDGTITGKPFDTTEQTKTQKYDLSVNEFIWSPNNGQLLFSAEQDAKVVIFWASAALGKNGPEVGNWVFTRTITAGAQFFGGLGTALSCSNNGKVWTYLCASLNSPACIMCFDADAQAPPAPFGPPLMGAFVLVQPNEKFLAQLDLPRPEAVYVPVEGNLKMHMWIIKPPGFDPNKKWPVAVLVHGGPQGAWEDNWSYRWNPELWAAQGYVVVMPNPRGSTGFGQKYVDEITADWGGKCYRDLAAGLDYVEKLPYVDKDRIGAAGGSFGGYMMDWFAVNDIAKHFKCLISHCSVWNFESMWGTTDELWFDEYEHGGLPWDIPGKYREFSPHAKAGNLGKNKVPMLLIQNDLDFRCPVGQGHELFSALQRQGVPSRFLNFPDEGHWVLKPRNSERWHKEVFAWLAKYVPPGGK